MNKKISTPLAISIIVVLAVVIISGIFIYFNYFLSKEITSPNESPSPSDLKMSDAEAEHFFGAKKIISNNLPESIEFITSKNIFCPYWPPSQSGDKELYKIPEGYYLWYCGNDYFDNYPNSYSVATIGLKNIDPWLKEEKPIFNLLPEQIAPKFLSSLNKTNKILFDLSYAKNGNYYGFDRYHITNQKGDNFLFLSNVNKENGNYYDSNKNSIFDPSGSHNYGGTGMKIIDPNSRYLISYIGLKTNDREMFKNLNTEVVFSLHDSFGSSPWSGYEENKKNQTSIFWQDLLGIKEVQACGLSNYTQDIGKSDLILEESENGIDWYRLKNPIILYDFQKGPCYDKNGNILSGDNQALANNGIGCQFCNDCDNDCNSYSIHDQNHFNCLDYCAYLCFQWDSSKYGGIRINVFYEPNAKKGFLRMQIANVILSDEKGNYFEPSFTDSSFSKSYNAYLDDSTCINNQTVLPPNCP